jgi:hypothetical protein
MELAIASPASWSTVARALDTMAPISNGDSANAARTVESRMRRERRMPAISEPRGD